MTLINILLIGIALSFDAMAAAATYGAQCQRLSFSKALGVGLLFGFFQGLMPFIGWLLGSQMERVVSTLDHWIAFVLLGILGTKMVVDATRPTRNKKFELQSLKALLLLAVATSIDALVAGISFAFITINIYNAILVIGLITWVLSLTSVYVGRKCGECWGKKATIVGGVILFVIGVKILLTHLL